MPRLFILLFISQLLTACSLAGGEVPVDHYYRLPEIPAIEKQSISFYSILINRVKVDGLYHERSMLYIEKNTPLEVKRYHYHYWVEPPAKLIQKYMASYLIHTSIAEQITTNALIGRADVEITPQVLNFERIIDGGDVRILVTLKIDARFLNNSKMFSKKYKADIKLADNSMHATANGFGQALEGILVSIVQDLNNLNIIKR